jgi:Cu/Ag efflux pump CusA
MDSARAAVASALHHVSFPLDYSYVLVGQPGAHTVTGRLASYVIAALIAIVLLAQAVTGSWRQALLIVAALPIPVAAGVVTAFVIGAQDSLAAVAGLLGVLAIAIHQAFRVTAGIRRRHLAAGGQLTPGLLISGAADASGPAVSAAAVAAAALLPFIAAGDTAGTEMLHTAATVIFVGLIAATLVNVVVLPAACLRFGPAGAPGPDQRDPTAGTGERDLTEYAGPPPVPDPREAPSVPPTAGQVRSEKGVGS